jgi:4-hydroxy-3-polyprenylbenzoate decarboxylase
MPYRSLNHFIMVLESAGELIRIKEFVSPRLEIAEIADRSVKNNGKALLFENNGTKFPLLILAFASDTRMKLALDLKDFRDVGKMIDGIIRDFMGPKDSFLDKLRLLPPLQEISSWMPKTLVGRGTCQEVVMDSPDLSGLPVLTCWPGDGGPFITLPCVHTKDPDYGIRNLGMYRMQVFSPTLTGMHWHMHKGSALHYEKYKKAGKRMPVSVTLGGDPVYTYAATAPLPENLDEYLFAGFLRKKKVEMVRCLTNELEVPSDVDFVIEGYVDPEEELIPEGPFGDHTGFYSLKDKFPRFHVTCITHRKDAVYPATIVGIPPQEDAWIGKATEHIFLTPLRLSLVPELADMHMPAEGVFHNIVFTSIQKHYPAQAIKVMNSLWGAGQMMFNKIMAVFDEDTDLRDYLLLARTISLKTDPLLDIHFIQGPVDILDHSSRRYGFGSKIGIDATSKVQYEEIPSFACDSSYKADEQPITEIQGVTAVNSSLPAQNISLIVIGVHKEKRGQVKAIARKILEQGLINNIKFVVFVDSGTDCDKLTALAWIVASNIDPMRDCFYTEDPDGNRYPVLFIDGTRKTKQLDGFTRNWPNVIVMDDQTIANVDSI